MAWNFKNSRKQGDYGLAKAIAYFAKLGWTVSVPLTDNQDYDLVVENEDGELKKVSIKTTRQIERGHFKVELRTITSNNRLSSVLKFNTDNKYDLLYVLTEDESEYLFPRQDVEHLKNALVLSEKYSQFKIADVV